VLAIELFAQHGIRVSDKTVAKLLRDHGYSLQAPNKPVEGAQHPDRNEQFERINAKAQDSIERGVPAISVDTKKKELVGNFKNGGREWQPQGEPELVDVHDFPSAAIGKAIPYGVYDIGANDGFVSVGTDHNTPVVAATSIEAWWKQVGANRYPSAREIFITADAGGSNSYRSHVWKQQLQRLADKLNLAIHVSHFPPGTSKWNKVEHRLFSFISINWRGRPLRSYETIISLIGNTTNLGGLVVRAHLDLTKLQQWLDGVEIGEPGGRNIGSAPIGLAFTIRDAHDTALDANRLDDLILAVHVVRGLEARTEASAKPSRRGRQARCADSLPSLSAARAYLKSGAVLLAAAICCQKARRVRVAEPLRAARSHNPSAPCRYASAEIARYAGSASPACDRTPPPRPTLAAAAPKTDPCRRSSGSCRLACVARRLLRPLPGRSSSATDAPPKHFRGTARGKTRAHGAFFR